MIAPGTRLGPYVISAPIGAGGMGEVYKATDTRLDRAVAIKVLPEHVASDPDLKQRFDREAKTLASLITTHICPFRDATRTSVRATKNTIHVGVTNVRAVTAFIHFHPPHRSATCAVIASLVGGFSPRPSVCRNSWITMISAVWRLRMDRFTNCCPQT